MNNVLILGNGISRLLYEEEIRAWSGELWACNYAYREWGEKLTRLTGHHEVLVEALADREARGHAYQIWTGQFGRTGWEHECLRPFTCPGEFRKDSGSALVAQALHEGFRARVCGFDLGGRDIYTLKLQENNKSGWTRRWQAIGNRYGWDRIEFVGYDHKPALMDPKNNGHAYMRRYQTGGPHIPDPKYIALYRLLYGREEVYDMREERRVKVRYIRGKRVGWETEYKYSVAVKMADRGEIEIIDEPPADEHVLEGDESVTDDMSKETLVKIAKLRGITGADRMRKDDLIAELKGTE